MYALDVLASSQLYFTLFSNALVFNDYVAINIILGLIIYKYIRAKLVFKLNL